MNSANNTNPLMELLVTLVIPSLILIKLSEPEYLGATNALLLAVALPLTWGALDWLRNRRINLFATLGLISVVLTGGIGLLQLDVQWLAIKEAAVPGLIGIAVLTSSFTRYPLVQTLICNSTLFDVERIRQHLDERNARDTFEASLRRANWLLGSTFFFSATMNYFLARYIVTSPSGTSLFNEQLGQFNLLSFPVIALPAMIMTMGIIFYLLRSIRLHTGLTLNDLINQS